MTAPARGIARDGERFRSLLCSLGATIRDRVCDERDAQGIAALCPVVDRVVADVVYAVDKVSEEAVMAWLAGHWPADRPVRLVMEGVEDHELVTFPEGTGPDEVAWICVIDPIDGTRNLMHDKRAGWVLAALAPARPGTDGWPTARSTDIEVVAMTEIPPAKQSLADQVSALRGQGPAGVDAVRLDRRDGSTRPIPMVPSAAVGFEHGFCSFSHALPDGKALLAAIEQELWDDLVPPSVDPRQIFEDQYLCSGGQLYEVASGRDRLVGDLRPLVADHLGLAGALVAHPYDVCTALILRELGGVFEDPWGGAVDVPLDTTSAVSFVAYANPSIAAVVRPALARAIESVLGAPG